MCLNIRQCAVSFSISATYYHITGLMESSMLVVQLIHLNINPGHQYKAYLYSLLSLEPNLTSHFRPVRHDTKDPT